MSNEDVQGCLAALGGIGVFIVLLIGMPIVEGLVFKVLWGWFVVTTFGLPALSIPVSLGLGLVASRWIPSGEADIYDVDYKGKKTVNLGKFGGWLWGWLVKAVVALLLGYLYYRLSGGV